MLKPRTTGRLALRNTARAWGRAFILVLLIGSALVARSVTGLVEAGFCREAVNSVTAGSLPEGHNAVVLFREGGHGPTTLDRFVRLGLAGNRFSLAAWQRQGRRALAAFCERYHGPCGELWLVRPYSAPEKEVEIRLPQGKVYRSPLALEADPERLWFTRMTGRYPKVPEEVAVPASLSEAVGLGVGDLLTLRDLSTGEVRTFTVTGVYEPRGSGPFYEYLLGFLPAELEDSLNFLALRLDLEQVTNARLWGTGQVEGPGSNIVRLFADPRERMASLAAGVYGSRSTGADVSSGLVGVAVLVLLLVAMVERRREAAVYKMVGMSGPAVLSVLVLELTVSILIAAAAAAPVYWLLATRHVLAEHPAVSVASLWAPFLTSLLSSVAVVFLGSLYPFGLASVGTPNQLLTDQRIFFFRRNHVLRGWVDGEPV
ncbi:MAG TPA: hypothetical protein DGR79_03340 [Clostridiales bacterium]|nr:hypothetical protein [Clostridiales bacterium]